MCVPGFPFSGEEKPIGMQLFPQGMKNRVMPREPEIAAGLSTEKTVPVLSATFFFPS